MPASSTLINAATAQLNQQHDSLVASMVAWVGSNPTATQSQFEAALGALAEPYPGHAVRIVDRTAIFRAYAAKVGGYAALRAAMLAHPAAVLQRVDVDAGRPIPTRAERYRAWLVGLSPWGDLPPADVTRTETRVPVGQVGAGQVSSVTLRSVSAGIAVERTVTWALVGGALTPTESAWTEVP